MKKGGLRTINFTWTPSIEYCHYINLCEKMMKNIDLRWSKKRWSTKGCPHKKQTKKNNVLLNVYLKGKSFFGLVRKEKITTIN